MKWIRTLCALLVLSACSSPSGPVEHAPLSFTKFQPIRLSVSSIEVVDEYKSPQHPPNVEHLIPYSPSDAVHIWVKDRLRATGGDRTMQIVIKDGSVIATPANSDNGVLGLFPSLSTRYNAKLEIEIRVYSSSQVLSESAIEVNAVRSITISDASTLRVRDQAFRDMISSMMTEVNAELERDIYKYMGDAISYGY